MAPKIDTPSICISCNRDVWCVNGVRRIICNRIELAEFDTGFSTVEQTVNVRILNESRARQKENVRNITDFF